MRLAGWCAYFYLAKALDQRKQGHYKNPMREKGISKGKMSHTFKFDFKVTQLTDEVSGFKTKSRWFFKPILSAYANPLFPDA
jgi:hypothetical protein